MTLKEKIIKTTHREEREKLVAEMRKYIANEKAKKEKAELRKAIEEYSKYIKSTS